MIDINDYPSLVIDAGSEFTRCGFGHYEDDEDEPHLRAVFASVVGHVGLLPGATPSLDWVDYYVGDEAVKKSFFPTIKMKRVFEHGMVLNWKYAEKIWRNAFQVELRVDPEDQPIFLTEPPLNPPENRRKTTSIFFEQFNCPAFYLASQAPLAVYASGRLTGMSVDSGCAGSHVVPVYEGHELSSLARRLPLGGRDVTQYLKKLLSDRGIELETPSKYDDSYVHRDIKEKLGYVSLDCEEEMLRAEATGHCETEYEYELPDETKLPIQIGTDRFRMAEILFRPDVIGREETGLSSMLFECVQSIKEEDEVLQRLMYQNVVLSGGSTLFPGFSERLAKDVRLQLSLLPREKKPPPSIDVIAPEMRQWLVWMGGSLISMLSSFQKCWITKQEYEDCGDGIVMRKCF